MGKGMNAQHLNLLHEVVREDIRAGRYHGAVIKVGRGGETVFEAAIGAADAAQTQPLRLDSVFNIFSVTKAFTNLLVLRAIEQGRFTLTTPITELIPEFSGHGREKILMWHLLSHQAGFPIIFEVKPGWYIEGANGAYEDEQAEMPWVGIVSTVPDLFRFADLFRRGGTWDGVRMLSRATLELAARNHTGDKVNELYAARGRAEGLAPVPAYIGLGFSLRGDMLCHHMFGTLATPGTFGNYGAGTSLFWIDPVRDITFTCLSAGVMEHNANTRRFQRIADIIHSAAL